MKKTLRPTFGRRVMKLICILLGVVLAFMLAATALAQQVMARVNIAESVQPASLQQVAAHLQHNVNWDAAGGGLPLTPATERDMVNILLIGQDRASPGATARSDSMILCTFDPENQKLTLTSFLRDLYVPIPGHGSNRINAAYAFGGMELLKQTLEETFGLAIDGCVEVDFGQFAGIVDLLGGVELILREDEAAVISQKTGTEILSGTQLLNGEQALAYARIRKLDADGDFSRTGRQRMVITALVARSKDAKLGTLLSLADSILPMITTDLSAPKILKYAVTLCPMLSGAEVVSQHIPAPGSYRDETIDGMRVLVPDLEAARQVLEGIGSGE